MSDDTELRDEEGNVWSMDNLVTSGFLSGHRGGLEVCEEYLTRHAVSLFLAGKHDEAIQLKRLVKDMRKDLEPKMFRAMREHSENHPSQIAASLVVAPIDGAEKSDDGAGSGSGSDDDIPF